MTMQDFLSLEDGGYISPDQAAALNRDLAAKALSDIAPDDRQNVLDYLLNAMAINSVEYDIREKIDALIMDLQS
ncbi:hypothetical protein SAMN05892877_1435 [Rhizobium subbaraonis]|uniref:Uncharacterized protein n=1 Tax=Rhizobium subbaraonis TaxID=908946 RepID=A0A285V2B2_9HYPH|nr:hypothetical protein [Rhizobium subbaraonis]MCR5943459.1 hypothetical protein [Ochrobactrum sp. XJ1]SOC48210.1 hypothetical protein SAMN05892877_1435 [Rhizobium subbaraonis]